MIEAIKRILLRLIENPELCNLCSDTCFGWRVKFNYKDVRYSLEFTDEFINIEVNIQQYPSIEVENTDPKEIEELLNSLNNSIKDYYSNKIIQISYNI